MRLRPDVLAVQRASDVADAVQLRLRIPAGLAFFEGHFPGLPVLPGVVQVHWAAHFAAEHLGQRCRGSRIEQLKFLAIIRPDTELTLALRLDHGAGMLHFAYADAARPCSSGRISFE